MLERLFKLKSNGTSVRTETVAGVSTFLTMSFIIAVNPGILSDAGIDFAAAFVATIIATVVGTLIIGLYAGWPVAVAPGMGLNAFFTYGVVLGYGFTWQQGLTAVFVSSVLFFIFRYQSCAHGCYNLFLMLFKQASRLALACFWRLSA